jgi:hypothetical protein
MLSFHRTLLTGTPAGNNYVDLRVYAELKEGKTKLYQITSSVWLAPDA